MALRTFFCSLLLVSAVQADPLLTSWATANSARYARVYTTTANRTSGNGSTTWNTSGGTLPHTLPAYADIYEVSYSTNWVYTKYTGLASYVTGPWLNPQGAVGNFWPGTQSVIRRFPRSPAQQTGTKSFTAAGASGIFVNGVAAFNSLDGQAWDGTQIQGGAQHTNGTYWWHRVAPVAEAYNFDYALGHQLPAGLYHNHQNPIALRYQLGDHVDYNASTKNYSESAATVSSHSPILGWAHDGYPIYGPYGYSTAASATSGIRRMVSGYVKRDGKTAGTDTVTSATTTIPTWYARYRSNHNFNTYTTTASVARSTDTSTYPIGIFAQDWAFLGDLIKSGSTTYAQATDYDLDEYNGRYCVTPEYPSGTYAYFTPLDSTGADTYPYVFNFEFYGTATGGTVTSITESVTNYFTGGAGTALAIPTTPSVTSGTVSLTWNSVEGGTYSVDASTDQSNWTSEKTSLAGASSATSTSTTYTALSSGTEYARVQRTAVASYDTPSVASTVTTAQSVIKSYSAAVNVAPTLTSISTLTGASKNTAFTISYATLLAASNAADANNDTLSFQIAAVSSGTLTKGGVAVTAGSTLISTGDSVVWTPASNVTGTVAAFTVKAYDGSLTSSSAVTVNVTVVNADAAPTLTTISTISGATEDTAFTLGYATLFAASNAADADSDPISFQISAVSSGTLTKGGVAVTAGSTTIASGDSVVWTPAANANGTLAAFTVKAYDGTLTSSTAVQVNITTTAVNDAPTLTTVNTLSGAVKNTAYTISYSSLFAASDAADVDGDAILFRIESISSGTLTKSGTAVTAGSTTLGTSESLVWTPASNATGTLAAFTVRAYDGTLASSSAVQVNISVAASLGDAQLTSWYTAQTGKYARITETDTSLANGTTETTWTRTSGPNTISQSSPVYAGPQQVDYSSSWVYVRTPSLGTYLMGPWYDDATRSDTVLFKNVPKNQGWIVRIPRSSTLGSIPTTKTQTAGYMVSGVLQNPGYYVDGVSIFDTTDGFSYANGTESSPGSGSWHRDAYANEQPTFDKSFAHQQNTGTYHNHANPIALRYQLGDAVSYNSTTKAYSETLAPTGHSPIIGWMMDGLPIYGPYGYSSALDSSSGIRRMVGGYVKRDGTTTGVDNISTTGSTRTLPAWATRNGVTNTNGPAVSTTYPFGRYVEDWAYLGDLIKTGSTKYAQGTDFDLNEYNVRYCVTPEFPSGTYAYFLNLSSAGVPQMPYVVNRWFYGTPTGSTVTSVTETVTNQFTGGANRPLSITNAAVAGTSVTLTWNAVEGGTYSVDASQNNSTWTSKATGLTVSAANTKSETHTTLGTSGTEYARVNRTALATYDTTGTVTASVAQTNSTSFALGPVNVAPTLTSISTISGATEDTAFTLSYATLLAASNAADANGDTLSFQIAAVSSGTLTKNGTAVTPGSTLISTGDSVVWTPAANANGTLAAFTVYAFDGSLTSSSPVQVNISTAAVNDAPTLSAISTLTGAVEDAAFTLSYATLLAASNAADVDGDTLSFQVAGVTSGTLTKNGTAVTPGTTLISTGDSVVWTSALHANGTLAAFTVKAWDGALASATAVQVSITTTAAANVAQWSGGAGTSAWGTGPNWLATFVPDSIDSVSFAGASPFSIDLGTNRTANGVAFSGGTAYTLANNTLTANGFTTSSPASGSVTHTVSSVVSLGAAATASVASSANLMLSGTVSGSGTLTKSGSGTLILGGAASVSGGVSVSSGTLQIGNGGTSGSLAGSVAMISGGKLGFNRSDNVTYAGVVSGTGALMKDGAGQLTFSAGGQSFSGVEVNAGALEMDAGTSTVTVLDVNGGTVFNLGAGAKMNASIMFVGADTGGSTVNIAAGAGLTAGTFGAGQGTTSDVITLGAGATWSSDSSFLAENQGTTGTYNINGGMWTNTQDMYQSDAGNASTVLVNITSGGSVSTATIRTSSGGGTWTNTLNNGTFTFTAAGTAANLWSIGSGGGTIGNANDVTLSGTITGTGALTKTGAGVLTLSADNSFTGALTIGSGTVQIGDGSSTVNTKFSSVVNNGALVFSAGANNSYGGSISGGGTWTVRGNGGSSGHTYSGTATHAGGTVVDGDTLTLGGGGTTGSVSGSITFINAGSLIFSRSDSSSFTNTIINAGDTLGMSGTGTISFGSTATFDTAQAYVGTLNLTGTFTASTQMFAESGGTLAVTGSSAHVSTGALYVGLTGSGLASVSGGGSLTAGNITFGLLGGSGSLNVSGAGTSLVSTGTVSGVAGTLSVTSQASVTVNQLNDAAVTIDNATLNLNSVTSSSAPIAITSGGATIAVLADSATLTGAITGSGMLSKTGRGMLIVSGTHSRSGDTSVNQGTLRMNSAALAATSRMGIATGATLDLNFTGTNTVKAFYIDGVLQAQGTWGGLGSFATNKTSLITGTGILNATTGTVTFSKWAASMGLDGSSGKASGFDDDPDNDGMVNGLEYVLGGNPLSSDGSSARPTSTLANGYLTLSFHRSTASIGGVTLSVDYGTTLTSWTSVPIGTTSATADGGVIVTITPDANGNDLISVAIPQLHSRLFARVTVTQ